MIKKKSVKGCVHVSHRRNESMEDRMSIKHKCMYSTWCEQVGECVEGQSSDYLWLSSKRKL